MLFRSYVALDENTLIQQNLQPTRDNFQVLTLSESSIGMERYYRTTDKGITTKPKQITDQ